MRSGFDSTKVFKAIGFNFLLSFKYFIKLSLFGATLGHSKISSNFSSSVCGWYIVLNCFSVTLLSFAFCFASLIIFSFKFVIVFSGIISLNEYILFIGLGSSSLLFLLLRVGRKDPLVVIILLLGLVSFSYFSTKFFGKEILCIFKLTCFACFISPWVNVARSVSTYELFRDVVL